jgi:anti-sigma B factor antagonist
MSSTMTCEEAGLQISIKVVGFDPSDTWVVQISGRATYDRAEELRRLLVIERGPRRVVLDLSELTEASSLALGALIELNGKISQQWGEVRLACLQPAVRMCVVAAGLHRYFHIHDSVRDALAA